MNDLSIGCSCGTVRGRVLELAGIRGNRVVCYCDDCQAYAAILERQDEILDADGGTDVFQMSPRHLVFSTGTELLACMRLTPKGILRWYAACCRTPIGNTLATGRIPFVGLVLACVGPDGNRDALDTAFGPVRGRVFVRFARGRPPGPGIHPRVPLSMVLRVASLLARASLCGDHKRSPFFDARSGEPIRRPQILRTP